MPDDDVAAVLRFLDALNADDVRALVACCAPEMELHSMFATIGGAVYRGPDEVRRWYHDLVREWGAPRVEVEAIYEVDSDVLLFTVLHGRGRQSGSEAALPGALVMRAREGLVVYFKAFGHREDALAELGVSEDELGPSLA
jgi:ketosteroid isomerase-like protein